MHLPPYVFAIGFPIDQAVKPADCDVYQQLISAQQDLSPIFVKIINIMNKKLKNERNKFKHRIRLSEEQHWRLVMIYPYLSCNHECLHLQITAEADSQ